MSNHFSPKLRGEGPGPQAPPLHVDPPPPRCNQRVISGSMGNRCSTKVLLIEYIDNTRMNE